MKKLFDDLTRSLQQFDKEHLSEILHTVATGLKKGFKCNTVRVYLEDLYEGMLVCQYISGKDRPENHRIIKYISPRESITSQALYENSVMVSWKVPGGISNYRNPFETIAGIKSMVVFPITYQMRPIGTLSLDWDREGQFLDQEAIDGIAGFLSEISERIEKAKRFRQILTFSKHINRAQKKEAAWMMMRSAVNLIEKLTLASVLIPSSLQDNKPIQDGSTDLVEIFTVYSQNKEHVPVYSDKDQISVLNDQNLISRIVEFDQDKGLVILDPKRSEVYTANVMEEQFPRKEIVEQLNLVSLYQIPKFNKETNQFICAVNYYTSEPYRFTRFETQLLQEHASMVEKLILEQNPTHIEIQVLSEIEELLSEKKTSLPEFLSNILAKTSELLGADCGTISLLKLVNNTSWLVIEDEEGNTIGAKSRDWKKNKIPPLAVGGNDLPEDTRSLNGYCAHTARPVLVGDVRNKNSTQGFYKSLSPAIRSELAVPILFENQVLGVINQDSFRINHFTEEHKKILQIIASLISQKVHNLKQIEEIKQEKSALSQEIEYRDPKISSYYLGNVIGRSRKIHTLVEQIDTVVESIGNRMLHWDESHQSDTVMGLPSLLIVGKTGTGKEFFFNNIYSRLSEMFRKHGGNDFELPVKKTNIAAYSGELTYSELFGHNKGAFTGADSHRQGILEEADGGIVFLDEIGDADPKTQVQLLRFLDAGVFFRLGENKPRHSRIFLIAATNKNLGEEIAQGRFREDLFHRLNALSFRIPSLDERRDDIQDLAIHFLGRLHFAYRKVKEEDPAPYLDQPAIEFLKKRNYRGNVRELKNILLRALFFRKGPVIKREDIEAACQDDSPWNTQPEAHEEISTSLLEHIENQGNNFWTVLYRPFKSKEITRDTVRNVIETARDKYQTNLPGLAIKLKVCEEDFRENQEENKKFISFKNFLYKTIRISEI
ncbi:MAG: GAF domain-containing protein [Candidatus Nitronauta litoralis]|uniref:GAF domain-containing protein n=1 Tax=Candidatus Nitronauta litoralis TaxID=2705533 RepID=A0A7T0G1L2_9BACT|nr:MAG: GAF domain-containing protein [Candidatus Nitronauta litoralis]